MIWVFLISQWNEESFLSSIRKPNGHSMHVPLRTPASREPLVKSEATCPPHITTLQCGLNQCSGKCLVWHAFNSDCFSWTLHHRSEQGRGYLCSTAGRDLSLPTWILVREYFLAGSENLYPINHLFSHSSGQLVGQEGRGLGGRAE